MSAWAAGPPKIQPGANPSNNTASSSPPPPPQVVQQVVFATNNNNPQQHNNNNNNQQQRQVQRCRASDEQLRVFLRGVDAVLQQWTALNLVCKNVHGEHDNEAAHSMRDDMRQWFSEQGEIFSDELEDYFYDFFEGERFAAVEDGSLKEVADAIHEMYRRCCNNDDSSVASFERSLQQYRQSNTLGQCVHFGGDDDNGDSDDDYCDNADAAELVAAVVASGEDAAVRYCNASMKEDDMNGGGGDDDDDAQATLDEDGAPVLHHASSKDHHHHQHHHGGGGVSK